MIPGTYNVTLYKGELAVAQDSVTGFAGSTTPLDITSSEPTPAYIFRIGEWDGTPAGMMNADMMTWMHPSDVSHDSLAAGDVQCGYRSAQQLSVRSVEGRGGEQPHDHCL